MKFVTTGQHGKTDTDRQTMTDEDESDDSGKSEGDQAVLKDAGRGSSTCILSGMQCRQQPEANHIDPEPINQCCSLTVALDLRVSETLNTKYLL